MSSPLKRRLEAQVLKQMAGGRLHSRKHSVATGAL